MRNNNILNNFNNEGKRKQEKQWYEREYQYLKYCALADIDARVEKYSEEQAKRLLKMMSYDR